MNYVIDNWCVIVGVIAVLFVCGFSVYKFAGLPTESQVEKIKKWLLYAVTMAEKDLGANTGKLKLHTVYDLFVVRFPTTAKLVSFETFSVWVDDALIEMRKMLENNKVIECVVVKQDVGVR